MEFLRESLGKLGFPKEKLRFLKEKLGFPKEKLRMSPEMSFCVAKHM